MGTKSPKPLLILAKVEQTEALVFQEGKLKRQNRAGSSQTQKKGKHREKGGRRNIEGRASSNIYIGNEGKKNIKIGAHNINGIKGDNTKAEQLAEFGKSEEYNIIEIIETNIEEQESKWINTREYSYSSFWTKTEKGKQKGSGIGLLVDQNWMKNLGVCKKFSPYLLKAEFFFRKVVLQIWIVYLPLKNLEVMKKVHKILIEEIIKNKKNIYYMILGNFNMILNEKLDMSREGKRNIDSSTRITKWLKVLTT